MPRRSFLHRTLAQLCCALLAVAPARAQSPDTATTEYADGERPAAEQYRAAEVFVPDGGAELEMDEVGDHPTVFVTVNGRGPFRFAIETGGAITTLAATTARVLGLPVLGFDQTVPVDSIGIGPVRLRNMPVQVVDLGPKHAGQVDGFLTLSAFYDLLLTIDAKRHKIRLDRGALPPPNGRDVVALHPYLTFLSFPIDVGGRRILALLDTQNGVGFVTTPDSAEGLMFASPPSTISVATGPSIGRAERRDGRLAVPIRVGDVTFERPIVSILPMPSGLPRGGTSAGRCSASSS